MMGEPGHLMGIWNSTIRVASPTCEPNSTRFTVSAVQQVGNPRTVGQWAAQLAGTMSGQLTARASFWYLRRCTPGRARADWPHGACSASCLHLGNGLQVQYSTPAAQNCLQ